MNCSNAQDAIQLDLDGELPAHLRAVLDAHLRACADCRERHRQIAAIQTAVHGLAEASDQMHAPMPSIDFVRPRRLSWRSGLAAAAVVALCFGTWLMANRLHSNAPAPAPQIVQAPPTIGPVEPQAAEMSPPKQRPNVTVSFSNADDVIAVPVETENPNVTIIWVYHTVKTAKASPSPATMLPPSS